MEIKQINGVWCVEYQDEVIQLTEEQANSLRDKNRAQLLGELFRMFPANSKEYKLLLKWKNMLIKEG